MKQKITFLLATVVCCLSIHTSTTKDSKLNENLIFPVKGELGKDFFIFKYPAYIDEYGNQTDGLSGILLTPDHRGTDFIPSNIYKELIVQAVHKGTVIEVDNNYVDDFSYSRRFSKQARHGGNCLTIKSNEDWFFHYCHLKKNSIKVKLGQKIKKGQELGLVGISGKKIRVPHIHFSVRNSRKEVINPLNGSIYNTFVKKWEPIWRPELLERIKKNYSHPNIIMGSIYNKKLYADDILLSAFNPKLKNKIVKNPNKLWCLIHGIKENDIVKARITWYSKAKKIKQDFEALITEDTLIQKLEWKTKTPLANLQKIKIRFSIYRNTHMLAQKYVRLN